MLVDEFFDGDLKIIDGCVIIKLDVGKNVIVINEILVVENDVSVGDLIMIELVMDEDIMVKLKVVGIYKIMFLGDD